MNKLNNVIKSIKLGRVLGVFLAGCLLVLTTACKPPSPQVTGMGAYNENRGQQTELYDPIQEKKGGMNQYSDTDPRLKARGVEAEARKLTERARQNLQNRADNPQEFVENYRQGAPLGERVKNITENVGESAKETLEDVSKGTQRGMRSVRENTQDTAKETTKAAERAADRASRFTQDRARDASKATQRAIESTADKAERAVDRATNSM
jgi:hypothetical protein